MLEFIWIDTHRDIFESGRVGTYIQKKLRKGISKIILNLLITNHRQYNSAIWHFRDR